jgi:hypothetical protein
MYIGSTEEEQFIQKSRVIRAELIVVTFLYTRRNEWVDWNGNTDKVKRPLYPYFSSEIAYKAAESGRTPGTQFSARDSVAVALHLDNKGMALLFDFYADSPFRQCQDRLKAITDMRSLASIRSVQQVAKYLRMVGYKADEMPDTLQVYQPSIILYERHATSGGSRHGLAWSMKPGAVVPEFGLQFVSRVKEGLASPKIALTSAPQATPEISIAEASVAALADDRSSLPSASKTAEVAPVETPPAPPESPLESTERQQVSKARIGQDLYRSNLERIESHCRVTGLDVKAHLIASHIKPWRDCTDAEKLDGNNGLLLSPHVDKLFDQGYISFSNEGQLLISPNLGLKVLMHWCIKTGLNVGSFNLGQRAYLAYHRERIFQQ